MTLDVTAPCLQYLDSENGLKNASAVIAAKSMMNITSKFGELGAEI